MAQNYRIHRFAWLYQLYRMLFSLELANQMSCGPVLVAGDPTGDIPAIQDFQFVLWPHFIQEPVLWTPPPIL